ncbi:hypothetical protein BDD12DRAFT_908155 [Trichophaea hybrida]|nr:hypothetical protein BDD12DRAFT_908155 [Trichophaea hybrida]
MQTDYASEISELLAVAGINGSEDEYYDRLRVEDGKLIESRTTPTGTEEKSVAVDVHPTTPACYLVGKTKKLAFCLDKDHVLQSYSCDIGAEEWDHDPGSLGDANIVVPDDSKLASAFCPVGVNVFYQDGQENLCAAHSKDLTSWSLVGPICSTVQPIKGTPLYVLPYNDQIHLFYIHQDRYMHYLESSASGWSDHKVEYAGLGNDNIQRFIVVQPEEEDLQFFMLKDNSVVEINTEKQTTVGKINRDGGNSEFELADKEECYRHRRRRAHVHLHIHYHF